MRQLIQSFKSGETILEDVPVPQVRRGFVLIRTSRSLVSLGTERLLVEFGKANVISKAQQQPDKVKQVLEKIKTDGVVATMEAVLNKLDQPIPLGYCNVGTVEAVGDDVQNVSVGDRVVSNGPHAEIVSVPANLMTRIPDNVSDEAAAFTVVGAIGLQGIRLADPTLGETFVVIGLGLIGLLTAQLLKANGCRVVGADIDPQKLKLGRDLGLITINTREADVVKFVEESTGGVGADAVIITASAKSNEIISQAARMSRKRGRIVLIGVVGLELSRSEFYEKELTFQVSCSYGPGRYDEDYEQRGRDYPLPYVRWTEKRNFDAVLQAISSGQLSVTPLVTERVPLEEYQRIYGNIGQAKSIASIIEYSCANGSVFQHTVKLSDRTFAGQKGVLGIIGAGNFTKMTMLPTLKKTGALFKTIASAGGLTGTVLGKKYGFAKSTTDYRDILDDPEIDLVLITTRHNAHARQVAECFKSGKHVFVEKPLALSESQLLEVIAAYENSSNVTVNVGFNRRFSPHSVNLKKSLGKGPMQIVATMNAGFIPLNSWVHDLDSGGGRIVGEACHFMDLCTYFTGSRIISVCMNSMGRNPNINTDNASILLKYEDGSNAVINYFSNGSKSYAKERIEVYSQDRTAIIDNFTRSEGYGFKGFKTLKTSLDKGHRAQFAELISRVKKGGDALIPFDELVNTTRASFAALQSLRENRWIEVS